MNISHKSLYEFGMSFLAPILNHYTRQIVKNSKNKIPVCLAREGWVLHLLLTRLQDKNLIKLDFPPIYLRVSRTLLFRSQLGNADAWDITLKNRFKGSVLQLLMKRFGIQFHEAYALLPSTLLDFELSLPEDLEKVKQWLAPHEERLAEFAHPTKMGLLAYLDQAGVSGSGPESLMLDIGYAGTIQKMLTGLINKNTNGLYFIANDASGAKVGKNLARMKGVFREDINWQAGYLMLERSLLLECIMTAPHGQVVDIRLQSNGQLDFFYGRLAAPQRHFQDLDVVFQGAVDGVEAGFKSGIEYSIEEIEEIFSAFACSPSAIPKAVQHLFSIDDEFSGNGILNATAIFGL